MQAMTFAVLGEPNRLQIVELLRNGPLPVNAIVEHLGIRQPQVSKHLRVLSNAGLVTSQAVSRHRIYELEPEPFLQIGSWAASFEQQWDSRLDPLGSFFDSKYGQVSDPNEEKPD